MVLILCLYVIISRYFLCCVFILSLLLKCSLLLWFIVLSLTNVRLLHYRDACLRSDVHLLTVSYHEKRKMWPQTQHYAPITNDGVKTFTFVPCKLCCNGKFFYLRNYCAFLFTASTYFGKIENFFATVVLAIMNFEIEPKIMNALIKKW